MTAQPSDGEILREVRAQLARAAAATEKYEALSERHGAHEKLVTAAFVEGRTALQRRFYELFPPSHLLAKAQKGALRGLKSPSADKRRKAAAVLEKQARDEIGMEEQLFFRDPRTVEALLEATADPDAKVAESAAKVLGDIIHRFDYRPKDLFERVRALHEDAPPAVRREIAIALARYDDARKWPLLLDAFSEKRLPELGRRRLTWVLRGQPLVPVEVARKLAERLLAMLQAEKSAELKAMIVKTLGEIGDRDTAAALEKAKVSGVRPERLAEAVAAMVRRPG